MQAIDADGNALAWSLNKNLTGNARAIKKVSPAPTLSSPANNGTSSGNPTFRWDPLNYAAKYNLEVYKNNDTTLSSANRVVNVPTVNRASYAVYDKVLPQSTSPYLWRVRRVDGSTCSAPGVRCGRSGSSVTRRRRPTRTPGCYVTSNDAFFTWLPVDGAANYRFELRRKGDAAPRRRP